MYECLPGTVLKVENGVIGLDFLNGIFRATSGLMLSQVREITGLDSPAIQNWIKRGWVSPPVNRRYDKNQLARILIINMLREVMQLEQITFLLTYLNGDVNDKEDDIIPESVLYDYICKILQDYCGHDVLCRQKLRAAVESATCDYVEPIPGAALRLRQSLEIILLAFAAAQIKNKAGELLQQLR